MFFNKKQLPAPQRKIAYIRTTSKGFSVNYRTPRQVKHTGNF